MTTTPTLWGNEVIFSSDTTAYNPQVTALKDNTFILTWENGTDIFGKHLDELGSFTAGDFLRDISTNSKPLSNAIVTQQSDGTIAVNYDLRYSNGDNDVVWTSPASDFDSAAAPFSTVGSSHDEVLLDSTARNGGGGAIAYNYTTGANTYLVLQMTDGVGNPASNQIFIDSSATRTELNPALQGLSNGNVAVAYESFNNTTFARDVRLQIFTPAENKVADVVVSGPNDNSAFPDVAELENGDLVVAWQQNGGIAFRRYHGNGAAIDGAPVTIPSTSSALLPSITHLNDGGFMIAWGQRDGTEMDGTGEYDSYLQRYDSHGNAIGTTIHLDSPGDQYGGSLATLTDGRVVLAYTSETGDSTDTFTQNYQIFDPREKQINGTTAADNIVGRQDGSLIHGLQGKDHLTGGNGDDKLFGDGNSDVLFGGGGKDHLTGGAGNDVLKGGAGNDVLYGGSMADNLTGGSGADTFLFRLVHDSTATPTEHDTIEGFKVKFDHIDLSDIDANKHASGDQAFDFIDTQNFHGKAGELRVLHQGGNTFVFGDVNGDGNADFEIQLTGNIHLKEGNFDL